MLIYCPKEAIRQVVVARKPEMEFFYETTTVYGLSAAVNTFMGAYSKIRLTFTGISFGIILILLVLTFFELRKNQTNFNAKTYSLQVSRE